MTTDDRRKRRCERCEAVIGVMSLAAYIACRGLCEACDLYNEEGGRG